MSSSTSRVSTTPRRLRQLLLVALGQQELGRRIAQARDEHKPKLSQQELAEKIGLRSAQSVSNYERGVTEVRHARLVRIADATGKPLSFFLEEEITVPQTPVPESDIRELVAAVQELVAQLRRDPPQAPAAIPQVPAEGP